MTFRSFPLLFGRQLSHGASPLLYDSYQVEIVTASLHLMRLMTSSSLFSDTTAISRKIASSEGCCDIYELLPFSSSSLYAGEAESSRHDNVEYPTD